MKRSKMIDEICCELVANAPYHTDLDIPKLAVVAENILNWIEEKGMLPPGYMKPIPFEDDGKQYPLVPGDFKNKDGIWCTPGVNEWEAG